MEICKIHGFPLTQLCRDCGSGEKYICEVCGVDGDHKYHEVVNLRPLVIDIMRKFEDNFQTFENEFAKVKKSRVKEFRKNIYEEFEGFFQKLHETIEVLKREK